MIAATMARAPRWLEDDDELQAFVITLCSSSSLKAAIAKVHDLLGALESVDQKLVSATVCEITINSRPQAAWFVFQSLLENLEDTDVAVQPASQRGKRLMICDMDMTIVDAETLDEVGKLANIGEQIAAITSQAMRGEMDFNEALRQRIALLTGQPEQLFHTVLKQSRLMPGAESLLAGAKQAAIHTILVSGGFAQLAEPIAQRLGFDEVYCNHLQLDGDRLTGEVIEPIVNAEFKCNLLQKRAQALQIPLEDCCAIGDGANDLPMIEAAGLGISYFGKAVIRSATAYQINHTDLHSALYYMK